MLPPYRVVVIDESHNLRNRETKSWQAIRDYLEKASSKVVLLSATPYNKSYLDLANQLRLFVAPDMDLGLRPDRLLRELGGPEFERRYQCPPSTLAAFEKSPHAEDWRSLMGRYLVRRTRTFIQQHYAETDAATGRRYLRFEDGTQSFFPARVPRTVGFPIDEAKPADPYARLYSPAVVDAVNGLRLPRYGLGNYLAQSAVANATPAEARVVADLSRAGKRLMGFCRTNLFKRLESSGSSFLDSLERHLVRNFVFVHALEEGLPLPIGSQDSAGLDTRFTDEDADPSLYDQETGEPVPIGAAVEVAEPALRVRARDVYAVYQEAEAARFKWLRADLFLPALRDELLVDCRTLQEILDTNSPWRPAADAKLAALHDLIRKRHGKEKILVFSQFADTVGYLADELGRLGVEHLAAATGSSDNPTALAWRFSPRSNEKAIGPNEELRVLLATDVLSEGQNLQDAHVVVNYDLPWAIIRLIQRVGRVDRIGQRAEEILCYSFLPADGVERIIRLRSRVRQRLRENAEVVGTDEAFFDDDRDDRVLFDLYNEKAGVLDGDDDAEVDVASHAYQIWKNGLDADPAIEARVTALPDVVYATKAHAPGVDRPEGVLVYARTQTGNDALAWVDCQGQLVSHSQLAVLDAAACPPDEPALARRADHHDLVRRGVEAIVADERSTGGQLGRPTGARFRAYERLKRHARQVAGTLYDLPELHRALDEIYRFPLTTSAVESLNRLLRTGVSDTDLARHVLALRDDGRLCLVNADEAAAEPRILCTLGLR